MTRYVLSIDQGTTSSRAMLFDSNGRACFTAQREFTQHYPQDGWVEHDPEEIWATTLGIVQQALAHAAEQRVRVTAIGIANQRETTLVWDKASGRPVYNAIVWQDRRTADYCENLREQGHEKKVSQTTGLLLDPYFSATKVRWILQHVEGARQSAERGELAFGTIDSFLIWRLTAGKVHATDATNASRTLMFDIHRQQWDKDLLELFTLPDSMLPQVLNCADNFGLTDARLLGQEIPIAGVAGDQQAALIGQACFAPGMVKSTYGTGCFMMLNTGSQAFQSANRLLTTIGYRINGEVSFALEGSIFMAGAAIQWLRDGIEIIQSAAETEAIAAELDSNRGVYLVPAFTGLGAPWWDPHARAAVFGMTRDSGRKELVRATLEAVGYQTADLLAAMRADGANPEQLRVDGGMVGNNWLCEFLAGLLNLEVARPVEAEITALGAACLAGLQTGMFSSLVEIAGTWQAERHFVSSMQEQERTELLAGWHEAVKRVQGKE